MIIITGKAYNRLSAQIEMIARNQEEIAKSGGQIAKDNFFTKIMGLATIIALAAFLIKRFD